MTLKHQESMMVCYTIHASVPELYASKQFNIPDLVMERMNCSTPSSCDRSPVEQGLSAAGACNEGAREEEVK